MSAIPSPAADSRNRLQPLGFNQTATVHLNLTPAELVEHALRNGEGTLTDTGHREAGLRRASRAAPCA